MGDVDEASVRGVAAALTPVPGGVGSVTTSLLLLHATEAAREQLRALVRGTSRWSMAGTTATSWNLSSWVEGVKPRKGEALCPCSCRC